MALQSVRRTKSEFKCSGGLYLGGAGSNDTGLSADKTPARNLPVRDLAVPARDKSIEIHFSHQKKDGVYAVFSELSWLIISGKTAEQIAVTFADAALESDTLSWMPVR